MPRRLTFLSEYLFTAPTTGRLLLCRIAAEVCLRVAGSGPRTLSWRADCQGHKRLKYERTVPRASDVCLLPPSERGTTKVNVSKLYHRRGGTRASWHPAGLTPPPKRCESRVLPATEVPRPPTEGPIWLQTSKCCPLSDVWGHETLWGHVGSRSDVGQYQDFEWPRSADPLWASFFVRYWRFELPGSVDTDAVGFPWLSDDSVSRNGRYWPKLSVFDSTIVLQLWLDMVSVQWKSREPLQGSELFKDVVKVL